MILNQILEHKREEVEKRKSELSQTEILKRISEAKLPIRDFRTAISQPNRINLIAEIKKTSPSKGILRNNFEPLEIARIFELSGANALSVLTEDKFFGGDIGYIKKIKDVISLPILRKDFILDSYQIYESAYYGADAILLIANLLTEEELAGFVEIARSLSLEPMAEAHSREDLEKVLANSSIEIIGINNRNLTSFEVDLDATMRLRRFIPEDKIVVAESGINSYEDVMYLRSLGVNAVLIGEAFMTAKDIQVKVKEVMGY